MNAPAPSAGMITAPQAARLLMVSDERVRQLVRAGYIARASHGRYSLVGVVQGYFRYRDDRQQKMQQAASSPLAEAKLREIEQRMAREDAHLIAMDEALAAYDHMTGELIKFFESMPPLIAKNPAELRRVTAIVDSEIRRLKKEFARIRHHLVTGQDDAEPDDDE